MSDSIHKARIEKDMEQLFIPDYDAQSMPSADKRAAYALEHIAFRLGRIDRKFDQLAETIIEHLKKVPSA